MELAKASGGWKLSIVCMIFLKSLALKPGGSLDNIAPNFLFSKEG